MTTWPYAYPIACLAGTFVQMVSFMRFGFWGLLLAPVTLLVMVLVIAALDDR